MARGRFLGVDRQGEAFGNGVRKSVVLAMPKVESKTNTINEILGSKSALHGLHAFILEAALFYNAVTCMGF